MHALLEHYTCNFFKYIKEKKFQCNFSLIFFNFFKYINTLTYHCYDTL